MTTKPCAEEWAHSSVVGGGALIVGSQRAKGLMVKQTSHPLSHRCGCATKTCRVAISEVSCKGAERSVRRPPHPVSRERQRGERRDAMTWLTRLALSLFCRPGTFSDPNCHDICQTTWLSEAVAIVLCALTGTGER